MWRTWASGVLKMLKNRLTLLILGFRSRVSTPRLRALRLEPS